MLEEAYEAVDAIDDDDMNNLREELGDVLFMAVNLARRLKIDPDAALNKVCEKFKKRFEFIEKSAQNEGKNLSDYTLEELDKFWDEAKLKQNKV